MAKGSTYEKRLRELGCKPVKEAMSEGDYNCAYLFLTDSWRRLVYHTPTPICLGNNAGNSSRAGSFPVSRAMKASCSLRLIRARIGRDRLNSILRKSFGLGKSMKL